MTAADVVINSLRVTGTLLATLGAIGWLSLLYSAVGDGGTGSVLGDRLPSGVTDGVIYGGFIAAGFIISGLAAAASGIAQVKNGFLIALVVFALLGTSVALAVHEALGGASVAVLAPHLGRLSCHGPGC